GCMAPASSARLSLSAMLSATAAFFLSLHDALPIFTVFASTNSNAVRPEGVAEDTPFITPAWTPPGVTNKPMTVVVGLFVTPGGRSEEHTSELQSRGHIVCRLLLDKKIVVYVLCL